MTSQQDGLVALGGILQAATDAYRASETERGQAVNKLREDFQQEASLRDDLRAEMETKIQKLSEELAALKGSIQGIALLNFSLSDIAGTWFEESSKRRVRVSDSGQCLFDDETEMQVQLDGNCLKLGAGFILSTQKSSRKLLLWELEGQPTQRWTYETPGGSTQVTLNLDVQRVLQDNGYHGYPGQDQDFQYNFSLLGCEVCLLLSRAAASSDEAGDKNLGVHFGLCKSTANNVDAITCRAQIELWNSIEKLGCC